VAERIELLDGSGNPLKPRRFFSESQVRLLQRKELIRVPTGRSEWKSVRSKGAIANVNAALRMGMKDRIPVADDDRTTVEDIGGVRHKWPSGLHPYSPENRRGSSD